jgi:hypothetical protein
MGSVGGKTPTEPNFYSFLSNLSHIEQDEVDVKRFVHLYKIRRLSMNVTFKFIWQKRLSCLTYERIVYHNISIFT